MVHTRTLVGTRTATRCYYCPQCGEAYRSTTQLTAKPELALGDTVTVDGQLGTVSYMHDGGVWVMDVKGHQFNVPHDKVRRAQ